jgi:hypothetical protein
LEDFLKLGGVDSLEEGMNELSSRHTLSVNTLASGPHSSPHRRPLIPAPSRLAQVTSRYSIAIVIALLMPATASAATVDPVIGAGIGTAVNDVFGDGSNVPVQTSITSVTYENPVVVQRNSLHYIEVLGTIQGIGWGGEFQDLSGPLLPPPEPFPSLSHYTYNIPFVLRWTANWDGTLVAYAHGYTQLNFSVLADSDLGNDNEARRLDIAEGQFVSDAVVGGNRHHAFFAINLSGLDRNGGFSATASEGPYAGSPVNPSVDVPVWRDSALVAERLLLRLSGRSVARSIGTGHSGGALVMQWIASNRGFSLNGGFPIFDGGNFITAYNPGSGTIFEGVIPLAGGGFFPVHPQFPLTSRMILIGGNTEYAAVDEVNYAGRLQRAGVILNASLRIYQVRNLPHNFAEIVESTPNINRNIAEHEGIGPSPDAERMAPMVAAAIDNMDAWLGRGTPPPRSWINGVALDDNHNGVPDRIQFSRADGTLTSVVPFVEGPAIDAFLGDTFELSSGAGFSGTVARYSEVLAGLDHVSNSLSLPYLRCRLGGYYFAADATLVPFADLSQRWENFGRYKSCMEQAMNDLAHEGLYDKPIGEKSVFTDEILSLFRH